MRNIPRNLHIGRHFAIIWRRIKASAVCCLTSLVCLKCSLNAIKKCYDLSLRGKISKILFCFLLFSFVFYGVCVSTTCAVLAHKQEKVNAVLHTQKRHSHNGKSMVCV